MYFPKQLLNTNTVPILKTTHLSCRLTPKKTNKKKDLFCISAFWIFQISDEFRKEAQSFRFESELMTITTTAESFKPFQSSSMWCTPLCIKSLQNALQFDTSPDLDVQAVKCHLDVRLTMPGQCHMLLLHEHAKSCAEDKVGLPCCGLFSYNNTTSPTRLVSAMRGIFIRVSSNLRVAENQ